MATQSAYPYGCDALWSTTLEKNRSVANDVTDVAEPCPAIATTKKDWG